MSYLSKHSSLSLFENVLGQDFFYFLQLKFLPRHLVNCPAKLQTSVFFSTQPHFSPGPLSCPGPFPPLVQPPHLAADAVISPQITPAN